MDVEQTIQFILQSQAQMEANIGRHEEMLSALAKGQESLTASHIFLSGKMAELTGVVRELAASQAKSQAKTDESLRQLAEDLEQTRENVNALVRTVDGLIRRDGTL